jgi:hypothetical protein
MIFSEDMDEDLLLAGQGPKKRSFLGQEAVSNGVPTFGYCNTGGIRFLHDFNNTLKDMVIYLKSASGLLTALLLSLALMSGCRTRDTSAVKGYQESPLTGAIKGQPWQFKYAYLDPKAETPKDDDYLFVFLPYKPKERCPKNFDDSAGERPVVLAYLPKRTKETKIKKDTQRTLVFSGISGDKPYFIHAKAGKARLDKIVDGKVVGQIYGYLDDENWVSGEFEAVVCNFADME